MLVMFDGNTSSCAKVQPTCGECSFDELSWNGGGILGSFMYAESQTLHYETGFRLSLAAGAHPVLTALLLA